MATVIANNARGRVRELFDPALSAFDAEVLLLKLAQADDALRDYDDLDALLTNAGNTEADFTNYARILVDNADITVTVDDSGNVLNVALDTDPVWTDAGGASNNSIVKLVVCAVAGAGASNRIPVSLHDFVVTTDGSTITANQPAGGFYESNDG